MRFMKCVLVFCFVEMFLFTWASFAYQCVTGNGISESLIQWHYTVFGVELAAAAFMKIAEIKGFKIKKNAMELNDTSLDSSGMEGGEIDER